MASRHTTEIDVSALHDSSWVRSVTLLDINIHSKGLAISLGRRLARTSIYRTFQINSYRKAYLLIKGGYAMRIDPFFSCPSESITGTKNIRSSIETEIVSAVGLNNRVRDADSSSLDSRVISGICTLHVQTSPTWNLQERKCCCLRQPIVKNPCIHAQVKTTPLSTATQRPHPSPLILHFETHRFGVLEGSHAPIHSVGQWTLNQPTVDRLSSPPEHEPINLLATLHSVLVGQTA